jgi:DMSO reductase anchor subunit
MGYEIARKHAHKLRTIAVVLTFLVPAAASLLTLLPGSIAPVGGAAIAVLAMAAGLVVERWLFFAEAQHVVTLYYGAATA